LTRFAGSDVEHPLMKGTLDASILHKAVRETRFTMSAKVVQSEIAAIVEEESDRFAACGDTHDAALFDHVGFADIMPLSH
jgi:hypothetical protein